MLESFLLVVVLCSVSGDSCQSYVIDSSLSASDCSSAKGVLVQSNMINDSQVLCVAEDVE